MTPESYPRKLAAILSADVKGYSLLMANDELATVKTLTAYRKIMAATIQEFRGRVVDSPGDNLLAEFASVVDAVACAVQIQGKLKSRNRALPEERRMVFRIGINLGDVLQEGDRIYGDGVNIAARIEGLADAEGVCISGSAYDQVENKLKLEYEYFGEHKVKNIIKPVRVYKIRMSGSPRSAKKSRKGWMGRRGLRKAALAAVIVLLVAAAGMLILRRYFEESPAVKLISSEGANRESAEAQNKDDPKTGSRSMEAAGKPVVRQAEEKAVLMSRIEKIVERLSRFEDDMQQTIAEKAALEEKLRHAEMSALEDKEREKGQKAALESRLATLQEKIRKEASRKEVLLNELERSKDKEKQPRPQPGQENKVSPEPHRQASPPRRVRLRSEPAAVGLAGLRTMLKQHKFYVRTDNESGIFHNDFEDLGNGVVIDRITGLMWEKGGSSIPLSYADAEAYVGQLNEKGFAGYRNWRIPTLEELCSLLQSRVKGDEVFPGAAGWRRPFDLPAHTPVGAPEMGSYVRESDGRPDYQPEVDLDGKKSAVSAFKPCWTSDINDMPVPGRESRPKHYVVDLFSGDIYGEPLGWNRDFVKAVRTAGK